MGFFSKSRLAVLRPNLEKALSGAQGRWDAFVEARRIPQRVYARSQQYGKAKSSRVRSTAFGVTSKARGLEVAASVLHGEFSSALASGREVLSEMGSDPAWKSLLVSDWEKFGPRTKAGLSNLIGEATQTTKALWDAKRSADKFISESKGLSGDLSSLESFAQGKGLRASVEAVGGLYADTATKVATYGAIGLAAYLFLPGIITRVGAARRRA